MDQSTDGKLIDVIYELDHRVRELESDIYDMRRDNAEMKRSIEQLRFRLDIIEPKGKTIHF